MPCGKSELDMSTPCPAQSIPCQRTWLTTVPMMLKHVGALDISCLSVFKNRCYRVSYANAVLGVVILSVRPSVRPSHACFVTNPKNLPATFLLAKFAICYRPSVCRLSVCNARAPYSGGSNFDIH